MLQLIAGRPAAAAILRKTGHKPLQPRITCRTRTNATSSALSTTTRNQPDESLFASSKSSWNEASITWKMGGSAILLAAAGWNHLPARCDNDEVEDVEDCDDPYENLPEKDEPTHCSICMTYRQGPCRPYWKKVEACTKDHEPTEKNDDDDEDDEDDENRPDPPCLKYMMPWIECASKYRNLYALIELDTNYTEGIIDLEATAAKSVCWAPGKEPIVDWTAWQDYVELLNPEWKISPVPSKSNVVAAKKPKKESGAPLKQQLPHFWKSMDHSTDPELVQVKATVPFSTVDGSVLECAYALDQDGHVIGFAYGTKPSEAVKMKGDDDSNHHTDDNVESSSTVDLTIRIPPNRTQHVVLAAAYTHVVDSMQRNKNSEDDDSYESFIYKSRPFRLDEVANRHTKVNVASI